MEIRYILSFIEINRNASVKRVNSNSKSQFRFKKLSI